MAQARECWALAFGDAHCDAERCLAAGYDNGDVKLFDLRTNRLRWSANLGNGVCGLQFDRRDIAMNKLVATCLEGQCHVFDMRTQHPKEARHGAAEPADGRARAPRAGPVSRASHGMPKTWRGQRAALLKCRGRHRMQNGPALLANPVIQCIW